MRIVSFNIHHGTVGRRGPVDPEQLGEVCAAFEADVICLQEVDQGTIRVRGRDLAEVAAEAAGMDHVFGTSQRMLGGRYGNAVLVRGEVLRSTVIRLPKVPRSRFWQEQRTVLQVHASIAHEALDVWGTHLAVKRWNNEPQLEVLLDRAEQVDGPLVVAGDLNRPASAVAPQAKRAGLRAVEHGPTYPASGPTKDIDHVLVSRHLRATHAEVRPTTMSDHAALVVELERT